MKPSEEDDIVRSGMCVNRTDSQDNIEATGTNPSFKVAGYIPNAKLKNLKLKPIPSDRLSPLIERIEESHIGRPEKKMP